jgi:Mg-chelatase subunit ChlD
MRIRSILAAAAVLAAAAGGPAATAQTAGTAAAGASAARERVEVVFVLDCTGSMEGLIEGAKQKIWAIANSIVSRKPAPVVRIGLIGYRDRGDEFITRRFDITDDLDAVFRDLTGLRADGGGDEPESVNQALSEAVRLMSWTPASTASKLVFLVGDCPPHMDYRDEVRYPVTCQEAARRGIRINTVQCGAVPETTEVWKRIAALSEGAYVALAQSGNMAAVTTPFDKEISRVSAALGGTVVAYGKESRREEAKGKAAAAAAAPAEVAADRAAFTLAAGGRAILGGGDLVADSEEGRVDAARLGPDELPPEMRGMSAAERAAYLARRRAERAALNAELGRLVSQRSGWLAKQAAAAPVRDSFDAAVAAIIADETRRP